MFRREIESRMFAVARVSLVLGLVASTFAVPAPAGADGDDLTTTIVDSPDPVTPGGTVTYAVTVENNSGHDHHNPTVWLRADATYLSSVSSPDGYRCATITNPTLGEPAYRCRFFNYGAGHPNNVLPDGASATMTFTAIVAPGAPAGTVLQSIFNVRSRPPIPAEFSADHVVETTVYTPNDMAITKDLAAGSSFTPGDPVTYEITVTNEGAFPASTPVVTDTLPAGFTATSATPSAGSCSGTTTVVCNVPDVAPGASEIITIVADTDPSLLGSVTNTATVAAVDDVNPANNTAEHTSRMNPSANLTLGITDTPDPVIDGETVVYELVVGNDGPSDAQDVVLTATVPAGTSIVTVTPSGSCSSAAGVVTCDLGIVPASGSVTTEVEVLVPVGTPPGTDVLTLTAGAFSGTEGTDPFDSESTSVAEANVDLSIAKSGAPPSALAGRDQVTYTVTVDNAGPATAEDVVVTDTLPAGFTFVSGTWPGGICDSSISCDLGPVAASDSVTVTVVADVDADAPPGTATNTASASTTTTETDPSNNSAAAETTVTTEADLSITKTAAPDPVLAGQEVTYTLTVDNAGPSDAQAVMVTDTLPVGVTFASSTDCSEAAGVVTCDLGTLAAGASGVATVFATTDTGTAHGTVATNTATVISDTTDPNPANNASTADITVAAPNDLGITKEKELGAQGTAIAPGESVVYELAVTNHGDYAASAPIVTDTLPPGLTATGAEWQIGGGALSSTGCVIGTPVVQCTLPDLGPGEIATVFVYADADPGLVEGTDLVNVATVSDTNDSDPSNNTAVHEAAVHPWADLEVTITDDPDPVNAGESVAYTVVVRNAGPSDIGGGHDVDVLVTVPVGTSPVGAPPAGCTDVGAGSFDCVFPALAAGAEVTLVFTVGVPVGTAPGADVLDFKVDAFSSAAGEDPIVHEYTSVTAEADLSITKAADVGSVVVGSGDEATYTLMVTNNGPSDAQGVIVDDPVPVGLTLVSATPSQGSCDTSVSCALGAISAGGSVTVVVVVTADADVPDGTVVTNEATVASDTTDPDPENNAADVDVTIVTEADLSITKTASPTSVVQGDAGTFTITVSNAGPSTAGGVVATDQIPTGISYVASTATQGTYDQATGQWQVGDLAPGATAMLTIEVMYGEKGGFTNTASVLSATTDPVPGNDSSVASVTVDESLPATGSDLGRLALAALVAILFGAFLVWGGRRQREWTADGSV